MCSWKSRARILPCGPPPGIPIGKPQPRALTGARQKGPPLMLLYIDPGTGSMLVTVLIGIAGAAVYALRARFMKIRLKIGGGKAKSDAQSVPFAVFSDNKRYFNVYEPVLRIKEIRSCISPWMRYCFWRPRKASLRYIRQKKYIPPKRDCMHWKNCFRHRL